MICFRDREALLDAVRDATSHFSRNNGDLTNPDYCMIREEDYLQITEDITLYAEEVS